MEKMRITFLVFACLIVSVSGFTQSKKKNEKAQEAYDLGMTLKNDGKFREAQNEFLKSYDLVRSYKTAYQIGKVYQWNLQKPDSAFIYFTAAIEDLEQLSFYPAEDQKYLSWAYEDRGWSRIDLPRNTASQADENDKGALRDFNKAIELSNSPSAYNGRGYAYRVARKHKEAIADFTTAMSMGLKESYVYANRAETYYNNFQFEEAAKDYEYLIKLNPDNLYNYLALARAYRYENHRKAIDASKEVLKRQSDNFAATEILAESYYYDKQYDNAIQWYSRLLKDFKPDNDDRFDALDNLGNSYLNIGKYQYAINRFNEAYELLGAGLLSETTYEIAGKKFTINEFKKIDLFYGLVKANFLNGDKNKAFQYIDSSLLYPSTWESENIDRGINYAKAFMSEGKYDAAEKILMDLAKKYRGKSTGQLETFERSTYSNILSWISLSRALSNDINGALMEFKRSEALGSNPLNKAIAAYCWINSGNNYETDRLLREIENEKLPVEGDFLIARTYLKKGNLTAAIEAYKRFAFNIPNDFIAIKPLQDLKIFIDESIKNRNLQQSLELVHQLVKLDPLNDSLILMEIALRNKINEFENEKNPPRISIIEPKDFETRGIGIGEDQTVRIIGIAEDESQLEYVKINGEPALLESSGRFTRSVELPKEMNDFIIEAKDKKGNTGTHQISIKAEAAEEEVIQTVKTGNFYALLIGVGDYSKSGKPNIPTAVQDVEDLRTVLIGNYEWDSANIRTVKNATRSTILKEMQAICSKMNPEDNLLIFFAGHGTYSEARKQGYWIPADFNPKDISTLVSNQDIRDNIQGTKARHVLLISDACFSGSIFESRNITIDDPNYNILYSRDSRKAITSGFMEEVPSESVFIKVFLSTLKNNSKRYLSAREIFEMVAPKVKEEVPNEPQYGIIKNTRIGDDSKGEGDFIFIRKK